MGETMHESMESAIQRAEADAAGGPVPGTEETPQPESSAGTQNTDTAPSSSGPPETVPYPRFKEVNDRLAQVRGYESLAQAGYDPDSLGRLATFEQAYIEDPVNTLAGLIDDLDLPDGQKVAVKTLLTGSSPAEATSPTDPDEGDNEPPPWAKPLIEDHQARTQREQDEYFNNLLDKAVSHWKSLDEKDGLTDKRVTPDRIILRQIRATADTGQFRTVEEMVEAARAEVMEYREGVLGSEVTQRGRGPLSVPGSGPSASQPTKFKSLAEASKAALADIEAGRMPTVEGM